MRSLWWTFLVTLTISSCDSNRVYENTVDINNAYWLADSIKSFEFNIPQRGSEYNIKFTIRNGVEYPHRNVYVYYTISDSTNKILDEELRDFQLFQPKSGYPLGNGSGNIREHHFDLLIGYKFPYAGRYNISFEQYMRYDSLPQVYSLGFRVETTD
jgi:gliding motility-associated lipoprotein GldH